MNRRILYVQYTNPAGYPPLEHSSRILANDGWQVFFLGTESFGANDLEFPPHPKIQVRCWKHCKAGVRQKLHYFAFSLWVLWTAFRWRAGWIYASDPLSTPVALLLNLFPWVRIVYHEHDSPRDFAGPGRAREGRQSAFQRLVGCARQRVARCAEFCVLPNQTRVTLFKAQTNSDRPVFCVWNCPSREDVMIKPQHLSSGAFVLFYHGSIVPARLPTSVIDALAKLPKEVVLRVAGYETIGSMHHVASLRHRAADLGVASRFEYLGILPTRAKLLEMCAQANVGLALMPGNPTDLNEKAMAGASNKPFDYLACGLALLVSDLPDWREMFVDRDYGLACNPDDPDSIARAVRWFLNHRAETHEMGERGRERILTEWSYERQFEPVFTELMRDEGIANG